MQALRVASGSWQPPVPSPAAVCSRPPSRTAHQPSPRRGNRSWLGSSAAMPAVRRTPRAACGYDDDYFDEEPTDIVVVPAIGILYDKERTMFWESPVQHDYLVMNGEGVWVLTCNSKEAISYVMETARIPYGGWLKVMPAQSAEQRLEALRKIVKHPSVKGRNTRLHFVSSDVHDLLNAWLAPGLEDVNLYLARDTHYEYLKDNDLKRLAAWERLGSVVYDHTYLPPGLAYGLEDQNHMF